MTIFFAALGVWLIASIPVAFLAGRFCSGSGLAFVPEWSVGNDDDGRAIYDSYKDALTDRWKDDGIQRRFVTPWTNVNE